MSVSYFETLDPIFFVHFTKHYLTKAEQTKFYLISKYFFRSLYRHCGLKRSLRFKTCFKKGCLRDRFAPILNSPISSFCHKHFPSTITAKKQSPSSCFLLATKSKFTKKIRSYPWGTLYVNERCKHKV